MPFGFTRNIDRSSEGFFQFLDGAITVVESPDAVVPDRHFNQLDTILQGSSCTTVVWTG